mgnify:FL=1
MGLRNVVPVLSLVAIAIGCDSTDPNPLAGTFEATSFIVTETGEAPMDVLALGGDLTITIAQNNSTTGTLNVPSELTGGSNLSFSMNGTAIRTGNTVAFDQQADTFVRDLAWTFSGNTLIANETVSGVSLAITLTRQ